MTFSVMSLVSLIVYCVTLLPLAAVWAAEMELYTPSSVLVAFTMYTDPSTVSSVASARAMP